MEFSIHISRKFMTSAQLLRRLRNPVNPGIRHQINAIEDAVEVIQSDPEGFEGLESDLFNAHQSHKKHEYETNRQREKIKLHLIKNKYFRKEKLPNLLTYAEKEHIRYLHSSDGEEWTVEKLAESFPTSAEIISKILKARWSPLSPKRILTHDAIVVENWDRFKNGEFKALLDNDLNEHLTKFADRDVNNLKITGDPIKTFLKKQWQRPKSNEFSSIISTLKKRPVDTKETLLLGDKSITQEVGPNDAEDGTYLQGEIKNKKLITFKQLKNKHLLKNKEDFYNSNETNPDERPEMGIAPKKNTCALPYANDFIQKFTLDEIAINDNDKKLYGITEAKQRIRIPRKLLRKGATYRVNNCYYDDDGELLYQVPGMSLK